MLLVEVIFGFYISILKLHKKKQYQNRILRTLDTRSTKQTKVENPSASFVLRIVQYWGM